MSTQGQGDVASRANIMADMLTAGDRIRYGDDAALLRELAAEIDRLRTLLSSSRGEQGWKLVPTKMDEAMLAEARATLPGPCDICDADIEDIYETAVSAAPSAPGSVPTSAVPEGAIDNGREFLRRLAEHYEFECDGGKLANCYEYTEAVRCFEHLAEYVQGSVPTSLAGQGTDDWDRIIATLREFSSLRAADGDHWEADAAERAAQEIERIPPVSRPALQSSPQPTAAAGQGTDTCTCDEFQSCPRCHTANLDPDWLEKELAEVAPQPTAGGDAPTIARGNFPDDEPECCPRCGNAWERPDPFALANGIDRAIKKAVSAERARVIELEKLMTDFLTALDGGALEMNSQEIGGHDDIPLHPWHEEWLHHARAALRSLAQQDTK